MDVIEEAREGCDEIVEVAVLLLDRPLNTDRRLGLWVYILDLERR
jgi:hypothetical protein